MLDIESQLGRLATASRQAGAAVAGIGGIAAFGESLGFGRISDAFDRAKRPIEERLRTWGDVR